MSTSFLPRAAVASSTTMRPTSSAASGGDGAAAPPPPGVPAASAVPAVFDGVYAPQHDSHLLIAALDGLDLTGRHVADLCTGSGVVGIAAGGRGASSITAWDLCPRAVACTAVNAKAAGVALDARVGTIAHAVAHGPYDVITANPPYVPTPGTGPGVVITGAGGPARAFDAGPHGRLVLDQLCGAAPALLTPGGTLLVVHSEFAGITDTMGALRDAGLNAAVIAHERIPFGPVLQARAPWLQDTGRLAPGQRHETLVVIRADKPRR